MRAYTMRRNVLSELDSNATTSGHKPSTSGSHKAQAKTVATLQQARRFFRSRKSGSENSRDSKSSGDRLCSPAVVQHVNIPRSQANRRILLNKLKVSDGPGFLNIQINPLSCAIVITIMEARDLQCPTNGDCNTFVKIRLLADEAKRLDYRSPIVYNSNDPVFNEKISFNIVKSDYQKRLLVGVFHHDLQEGCVHLLGSMSFGIQSIMSKSKDELSGWYYLLPEEFGHFKHKKVKSRNKEIQTVNKECDGMQNVTVRAVRGPQGFGFSIGGGCPCQITRIVGVNTIGDEKPAVGDFVVSVNSRNVSRATLESVAKLIRKCKVDIKLELCRSRHSDRNVLTYRHHSDPFYPQLPLQQLIPAAHVDNRCAAFRHDSRGANRAIRGRVYTGNTETMRTMSVLQKQESLDYQLHCRPGDYEEAALTGAFDLDPFNASFRRTVSAVDYFAQPQFRVYDQWIPPNGQIFRPSEV